MANFQIGNRDGLPAVGGEPGNGGSDEETAIVYGNLNTLAAMRARLQTLDAATYTDTRLNTMTMNDMVFAIRNLDHVATIGIL